MQLMIRKVKKSIFSAALLSMIGAQAQNPSFSVTEYKKALWMTTRMYGGQRSGNNNWLLANHLPSGLAERYRGTAFIDDRDTDGYDLSGGWHDCGDHVKFGQTQYFSGYMLLKAYAEIPEGYDDRYSHTYVGYRSSNKWNFEDNGHDPNGIPDIVDEVKHATDYFIKCTRSATTFYYQVGQGVPDHKQWVTATKMQTLSFDNGGQTRVVYKNPKDASMVSLAGATLALMSRIYKAYDPAYAQTCLTHALYAYEYAKANPGTVGAGDNAFYGADKNWRDDYVNLLSELYWTTKDAKYKTEAQTFTFDKDNTAMQIYGNPGYGFDYQNDGEIAIYNLAKLGTPNAAETFRAAVNIYMSNTLPDGQFSKGNTSWGPLRYNGSAALLAALDAKLNGKQTNTMKFIYNNIDFILGKNSANQSFVVGFGSKSPRFPHHRNVYLRDDNPSDANKAQMTIPAKNAQFGYMIGGTRDVTKYKDVNPNDYTFSEGGIDYNVGLVGALAYINGQLDPVDLSRFGSVVITSVDDQDMASDCRIFPNPNHGIFSVEMPKEVSHMAIVDAYGKEVKSFVDFKSGTVDLRDQQAGIYFIKYAIDQRNYVFKLVKE